MHRLFPLLLLSCLAAIGPIGDARADTGPLDRADEAMQRGDWAGVSAVLSAYDGLRDGRYLALAGRLAMQQQRYSAAAEDFDAAMRLALPSDRSELRRYRDHARRCAQAPALDADTVASIQAKKKVRPVTPPEAINAGVDGVVEVVAYVNARGRVDSALVLTAHPPEIFDEAVLRAVDAWTYQPLQINQRAAPFCVQLPFSFRFAK